MKELLNDKKFNNTRIIIIGDHGYRNDPGLISLVPACT